MGYDLINRQGEPFRFNIWVYPNVLKLAYAYGWEPKGTKAPRGYKPKDGKPWDNDYFDTGGARVTQGDALGMGNALLKALTDIPKIELGIPEGMIVTMSNKEGLLHLGFTEEQAERYSYRGDIIGVDPIRDQERFKEEVIDRAMTPTIAVEPGEVNKLLRYFSNEDCKKVLVGFILYCSRGGFTIN